MKRAAAIAVALLAIAGSVRAQVDLHGDPLAPGAVARLGTVRLRHGGPINAVAWAAAGGPVVSVGDDAFVRFWDPRDGRPIAAIELGSAGTAVACSPDGKSVAAAGADGAVRLFDVHGKPLAAPRDKWIAHEDGIDALAWSGDGSHLASGGRDGSLILWNARTAGKVATRETGSHIRDLAFDPRGTHLVAAFGPPDSADESALRFYDPAKLTELAEVREHRQSVGSVAFSADGKRAASGSDDGAVHLWNPAKAGEPIRIAAHRHNVMRVLFSPDSTKLVSVGRDRRLAVWNALDGSPVSSSSERGELWAAAFAGDGRTLAVAGEHATVSLVDPLTARDRLEPVGHAGPVFDVEFAPDGRTLATGSADRSLRTWRPDGTAVSRHVGTQGVMELAFSPDGKSLITAEGQFHLRFRAPDGTPLRTLYDPTCGLAFTADSSRLVTWGFTSAIRIRTPQGVVLSTMARGTDQVVTVALSPDGRLAAAGSFDGVVSLWDLRTGRHAGDLPKAGAGPVRTVFSPDGRRLCALGRHAIHVYETASRSPILSIANLASPPTSGVFAPDNRRIIWADAAGRLHPAAVRAHPGLIYHIALSPDRALLATASADTTVLVWRVRDLLPVEPPTPAADRFDPLWTALASGDAALAHRAIGSLVALGEPAVARLAEPLSPVAPVDPVALADALARLDSDEFTRRSAAATDLRTLGEPALPQLRIALDKTASLEVRLALRRIIADLDDLKPAEPDLLRRLRAVEVLERIASRLPSGLPAGSARGILARLAAGADARLTREAAAALARLEPRP